MDKQLIEASRFLSYVLRHQPDAIGIKLDHEGWTDIAKLIVAASVVGKRLDRDLIKSVVATNDKQRFSVSDDGLQVRAVQGHSAPSVDIAFAEQAPPEYLYHGTTTSFLESIRSKGLLPGSRKYVHLSEDEELAFNIGRRYGKPIALKVAASLMAKHGFKFFRSENGVWLALHVPWSFLSEW
jgi:putative RNA 2'-phosphotransferase